MSHLFDSHGIKRIDGSFQAYIDKFFDAPLCCCGCGVKVKLAKRDSKFSLFAEGCRGLHRSRNPGCIDFYLYLGLDVDDAIALFRDRQSKIAKKYSTDELKRMLREINSGNKNPSSIKSILKRTGKPIAEIKAELSKTSAGSNNGFFGRTHIDDVLIKNARRAAQNTKFVTKPEMVIWGILHTLGIDFEFQVAIDRYIVDFVIGKTIIEVFGDYWHSDKLKSADKPTKDKTKIGKLTSLGYSIQVIWESEIMKSPRAVVEKLRKLLCA